MATLKIDAGDKMEVLGESFVWFRSCELEAGNLYIELCDLPTVDRDFILDIKKQIASLTEELSGRLLILSHRKSS